MNYLLLGMLKIILLGFFSMGFMRKLWQQLRQVKVEVNSLMRYLQMCGLYFLLCYGIYAMSLAFGSQLYFRP